MIKSRYRSRSSRFTITICDECTYEERAAGSAGSRDRDVSRPERAALLNCLAIPSPGWLARWLGAVPRHCEDDIALAAVAKSAARNRASQTTMQYALA